MKSLILAVSLLLASPALARAETTLVARDVPLHGGRTLAAAVPRFDLVGVHWRGTGSVQFRTRAFSGRWSAWHAAAPEAEDGPDRATLPGWHLGNPYWTGASDAIAYRLHGRVTRLRAYFVWSPVDALPPRRLSIAGSPAIIPRASWGADESIRRAAPRYADAVRYALVHHTAGTNAYSPSQSAAIVRGIEIYHVQGNGWNDIGYNFLVDKYGQVFEGRFGGVDKNVIGAHAEGFNDGSVGVAVLGTYNDSAPPPAAQTAVANLLAWRLDIAHVDPLSTLTVASGGNAKYPAGVPVSLRAVSGHRDTGFTTCPGNALYARLGAIAGQAAAIGLPKLYAPVVRGEPGGAVQFTATLSEDRPWTITVADASGRTIASGSGSGTAVDWTWDASTAPAARYSWTIAAGVDMRPATGFVGAAPVVLALKAVAATPKTVQTGQRAKVDYTLTAPATVTAELLAPGGNALATLFSGRRNAGKQSFTFTADSVSDGDYQIQITATNAQKTVTATVPVIVDRTVRSFTTTTPSFSPNGDGRLDVALFSVAIVHQAQLQLTVNHGTTPVASLPPVDASAGATTTLQWDGSSASGRVPDGAYTAVLTAVSSLGTTVYPLTVRVDTTKPRLRALSFRRLVFRISEPATVHLVADGRRFASRVRAGVFAFYLRRLVRHVRIDATDAAGNVSSLHFH